MELQKKIVLIGYMASGKSLIGSELSKRLNRKFIDLDLYIAAKETLSIPEIFDKKGESYFRRIEFNYLKDLMESTDDFVLSVGGGTSCSDKAMKLINEKALSIYLKANVTTLYDRLLPKKIERPLLANISHDFLIDYIENHLNERKVYYNQAEIKVIVDDKSPEEIIHDIMEDFFMIS